MSDGELQITTLPGAGIHSIQIFIDAQKSVPQSTFTSLIYRAPFIEAVQVGLFGGEMNITGKNFGPNFNGVSALTQTTFSVEAKTLCESPIGCTQVQNPDSEHTHLRCTYQEWGKSETCSDRFLVVTVGGQSSNRYPLCWGAASYVGSLNFAKTPCQKRSSSSSSGGSGSGSSGSSGSSSSSGSSGSSGGSFSNTIKEGQTFSDVVSLSVEPKDLTGVVRVSVNSNNEECQVRLHQDQTYFTFTRETAKNGFPMYVDVSQDAIVSAATSVAGFGCNIEFIIDSK